VAPGSWAYARRGQSNEKSDCDSSCQCQKYSKKKEAHGSNAVTRGMIEIPTAQTPKEQIICEDQASQPQSGDEVKSIVYSFLKVIVKKVPFVSISIRGKRVMDIELKYLNFLQKSTMPVPSTQKQEVVRILHRLH
jgi:hypothetical protein